MTDNPVESPVYSDPKEFPPGDPKDIPEVKPPVTGTEETVQT